MKVIAAALRRLADVADPPRVEPLSAKYVHSPESAFAGGGHLDSQRREDALRLMDPETKGYLLVVCRDKGGFSKLELTTALTDGMWAPMRWTLERIVHEGERVHGDRSAV